MQSAKRMLIGGGVAYNLELGFVPDTIWGFTYNATPDSIVRFRWLGPLSVDNAVISAGGGVYGWSIDGAVVAELTADTGFTAYEGTKTPKVMIESPQPGVGLIATSVSDWAAASTTPTARSATVIGTIIRPPTHNGYVYECTTATGTYTTEPTAGWTTTVGETSTDGGSNVWTCRNENVVQAGSPGVTLGATLMTDGNTVVIVATKIDDVLDLGDIG